MKVLARSSVASWQLLSMAVLAAVALLAFGVNWWAAQSLGDLPTSEHAGETTGLEAASLQTDIVGGGDAEQELVEGVSAADSEGTRQAVREPLPDVSPGDLVVELRDTTGRAVDEHWIRARLVGDKPDMNFFEERYLNERTDDQGRVVFAAADVASVVAQRPEAPLRVEIGSRQPTPVMRDLPPRVIPEEPVLLIADVGRIVVHGVQPDGTPWTSRCGLLVRPKNLHYFSNAGPSPRVAWVPIGVPYELRLYGCGMFRDVRASCPPLSESERDREHFLRLGPEYPGISATAVFESGAVVPEDTFLRFSDRNGGARVRVGGAFTYPLKNETPGSKHHTDIVIDDQPMFYAGVDLIVPPEGDVLDLGQIVVRNLPVLAAGRVTVPEGHSAAGVGVSVDVLFEERWSSFRPQFKEESWGTHPQLRLVGRRSTTTEEDGRFMVFADDVPGRKRLSVYLPDAEATSELIPVLDPDFKAGATDLRVALVTPGAIGVQVSATPATPRRPPAVSLYVRPESWDAEILIESNRRVDRSGRIDFTKVPPGIARLELHSQVGSAPIGEISGIRVVAGETVDAGLLAPVMNRPPVVITVRGDGEAVERAIVRYGPAGSGSFSYAVTTDRDGVVEVPMPSASLDLAVSGASFRTLVVESVDQDTEVALQPGPTIQLIWGGLESLPPSEGVGYDLLTLTGHFEAIEGSGSGVATRARALPDPQFSQDVEDVARGLEFRLDEPGTYRLKVGLQFWRNTSPTSRTARGAYLQDVGVVEVRDTAEIQRFEIGLPTEWKRR